MTPRVSDDGFRQVADGVHVWRYPVLDVNATLVTGDGAALLVDTLSTDDQARELAEAVRRITPDPLILVNTHHHFDHCFGNAVLAAGGRPVWGHEETAAVLSADGEALQQTWRDEYARTDPTLAEGLARVRIHPPDRLVHTSAELDVGGRRVVLRHLGRGHTAGDLVVEVPDADVVVAGDLVEESGPPDFGDSYPVDWADTLAELHRLLGADTVVVPGHGDVVDRDFVAAQQLQLAQLAWLVREGHAVRAPAERVAAQAPFPSQVAVVAVRRGYAELSGRAD